MRNEFVVPGIVIGLGLCVGGLATCSEQASTAALSEEARLAIELRCGAQVGRSAAECRRVLKRLYLAGSLDPDTTLRSYCKSVKHGQWGGAHGVPPKLCVERYGGWPSG